MKKTLAALAAVALVAVGFVALTGFRHGMGRHGHDPAQVAAFVTARLDSMLDEVDATPAQRDELHALKDRLLAKGQALHADHAATHAELVAEWKADRPDAAKLHALVDARIDALRAFAHEAVDGAIEAHDALTPAQRAKVTAKLERHASGG
jgi:protein CpxP